VRKFFGYALIEIGVLLYLFGFSMSTLQTQQVFYGIDDSWPMLARVALIFLAAICVFGGFKFITLGMRTFQPTAEKLLSSDPRPPVVFLRSFNDDTLTVALGGRNRSAFNSIPVNAIPDPTAEFDLADALNRIGPPVAIGRPGEILPQMGAARAYVPDSEWQETIAQWMRISRAVIMMVHHLTPGTHWELNHAIANLPPERLVLYFPPGKAFGADREAQYAACGDILISKFPRGLPASLGSAQFIVFDPDWSPQKIENAQDLIARHSGGVIPKDSILRIRQARAVLLISLVLGLGLEIAYAVYWAIKQIADS
jgi:hypothetical protein